MQDKTRSELAKDLFSSKGFPDPLDPNKSYKEFGLQVGKAIENEWLNATKTPTADTTTTNTNITDLDYMLVVNNQLQNIRMRWLWMVICPTLT